MKQSSPEWMIGFGLFFIVLHLIGALGAPFFASFDPKGIQLREALSPPSQQHLLGTDQLGRDLFSRMLYGSRVSLEVGFVAVGLAVFVGVLTGCAAGYWGGWIDALIMRCADVMLCFPALFLILSAVAFLDPRVIHLIVIIGLTSWMGVARLVRAEVLSLKKREFILAAQAVGASSFRILFKHLLPHVCGPVLVSATFGVGSAILLESALSFLGIGVQPPTPSWGNILAEGKATLGVAWWLTIIPGCAIFTVVLSCHLLGEGLRLKWRRIQ